MFEKTGLRIYTESPEIYLSEAFGPHEYDGSVLIELEFEDMDESIKLTQEAAANMAATLHHLLDIEENYEEEITATNRVIRGMAFTAIMAASAATSVTIFGSVLYLAWYLLLQ